MIEGIPWWGDLIIMSALLVVSTVTHEQAHYKKLKEYYPTATPPRFRRDGWSWYWSVEWPPQFLTVAQHKEVLLFGVVMGLYPLVMVLFFSGITYWLLSLLFYAVGSWSDLKVLWRLP